MLQKVRWLITGVLSVLITCSVVDAQTGRGFQGDDLSGLPAGASLQAQLGACVDFIVDQKLLLKTPFKDPNSPSQSELTDSEIQSLIFFDPNAERAEIKMRWYDWDKLFRLLSQSLNYLNYDLGFRGKHYYQPLFECQENPSDLTCNRIFSSSNKHHLQLYCSSTTLQAAYHFWFEYLVKVFSSCENPEKYFEKVNGSILFNPDFVDQCLAGNEIPTLNSSKEDLLNRYNKKMFCLDAQGKENESITDCWKRSFEFVSQQTHKHMQKLMNGIDEAAVPEGTREETWKFIIEKMQQDFVLEQFPSDTIAQLQNFQEQLRISNINGFSEKYKSSYKRLLEIAQELSVEKAKVLFGKPLLIFQPSKAFEPPYSYASMLEDKSNQRSGLFSFKKTGYSTMDKVSYFVNRYILWDKDAEFPENLLKSIEPSTLRSYRDGIVSNQYYLLSKEKLIRNLRELSEEQVKLVISSQKSFQSWGIEILCRSNVAQQSICNPKTENLIKAQARKGAYDDVFEIANQCNQNKNSCPFPWEFNSETQYDKENVYQRLYPKSFYKSLERNINSINKYCFDHRDLENKDISSSDPRLLQLRTELMSLFGNKQFTSLLALPDFRRAIGFDVEFAQNGDVTKKGTFRVSSRSIEERCLREGVAFKTYLPSLYPSVSSINGQDWTQGYDPIRLPVDEQDGKPYRGLYMKDLENPLSDKSFHYYFDAEFLELAEAEQYNTPIQLRKFLKKSVSERPLALIRYAVLHVLGNPRIFAEAEDAAQVFRFILQRANANYRYAQFAVQGTLVVGSLVMMGSFVPLLLPRMGMLVSGRIISGAAYGLAIAGSTEYLVRKKSLSSQRQAMTQGVLSGNHKSNESFNMFAQLDRDIRSINQMMAVEGGLTFLGGGLHLWRHWEGYKRSLNVSWMSMFDDETKVVRRERLSRIQDAALRRPLYVEKTESGDVVASKLKKGGRDIDMIVPNDPMQNLLKRSFVANKSMVSDEAFEEFLSDYVRGGGNDIYDRLKMIEKEKRKPRELFTKKTQEPEESVEAKIKKIDRKDRPSTNQPGFSLYRPYWDKLKKYKRGMWFRVWWAKETFKWHPNNPKVWRALFERLEELRLHPKVNLTKEQAQKLVDEINQYHREAQAFGYIKRFFYKRLEPFLPPSKKRFNHSLKDQPNLIRINKSGKNADDWFFSYRPRYRAQRNMQRFYEALRKQISGENLYKEFRRDLEEFYSSRQIDDHELDLQFRYITPDELAFEITNANKGISAKGMLDIFMQITAQNRRKYLSSVMFNIGDMWTRNVTNVLHNGRHALMEDSGSFINRYHALRQNITDQFFTLSGIPKRIHRNYRAIKDLLHVYKKYYRHQQDITRLVLSQTRDVNSWEEARDIVYQIKKENGYFNIEEALRETSGKLKRGDAVNHIAFQNKVLNKQLDEYWKKLRKLEKTDSKALDEAWEHSLLRSKRYRELRENCIMPGAANQMSRGVFNKLGEATAVLSPLYAMWILDKEWNGQNISIMSYDALLSLLFIQLQNRSFHNPYKSYLSIYATDWVRTGTTMTALDLMINKPVLRGLVQREKAKKRNRLEQIVENQLADMTDANVLDEIAQVLKSMIDAYPEMEQEHKWKLHGYIQRMVNEIKADPSLITDVQDVEGFWKKLYRRYNKPNLDYSDLKEVVPSDDLVDLRPLSNREAKRLEKDVLEIIYQEEVRPAQYAQELREVPNWFKRVLPPSFVPGALGYLRNPQEYIEKGLPRGSDVFMIPFEDIANYFGMSLENSTAERIMHYRFKQNLIIDLPIRGLMLGSGIYRIICGNPLNPRTANIVAGSAYTVGRMYLLTLGYMWRNLLFAQ